jgi:hypothetical protein
MVRRIESVQGVHAGGARVLDVGGYRGQSCVHTRGCGVRRITEHGCDILRPHLSVLRFDRCDGRCVVTEEVGGNERRELGAIRHNHSRRQCCGGRLEI